MMVRMSPGVGRGLSLMCLLLIMTSMAEAQFDKFRKRIPGMGGSSEVDAMISQSSRNCCASARSNATFSPGSK
jgi:hypothetical protein